MFEDGRGGSCVRRLRLRVRFDRRIALSPLSITNVTFAGTIIDRIFVTSAAEGVVEPQTGALFEIDPGYTGRLT